MDEEDQTTVVNDASPDNQTISPNPKKEWVIWASPEQAGYNRSKRACLCIEWIDSQPQLTTTTTIITTTAWLNTLTLQQRSHSINLNMPCQERTSCKYQEDLLLQEAQGTTTATVTNASVQPVNNEDDPAL